MRDRMVPFVNYEEFVVAANGLVTSAPQKFRNLTSKDMLVKYLLFDPNNNRVHIRFGLRGGKQFVESFAHPQVLNNVPIPDAATDGGFPLWKLDEPVIVPPAQGLNVELEDSSGVGRTVNVMMLGRKLDKSGRPLVDEEPFFLLDRASVTASSFAVASLQGDQDLPVEVHAFSLRMEETGTANLMRQLAVRVTGGGLKDWSPQRVPASLHFPHRNAVCSVYRFPGKGVRLRPTEGFQFELHDVSGSGDTVRVALLGHVADRRA